MAKGSGDLLKATNVMSSTTAIRHHLGPRDHKTSLSPIRKEHKNIFFFGTCSLAMTLAFISNRGFLTSWDSFTSLPLSLHKNTWENSMLDDILYTILYTPFYITSVPFTDICYLLWGRALALISLFLKRPCVNTMPSEGMLYPRWCSF